MKPIKDDLEQFLESRFNAQTIAEIHRQAEFEAVYLQKIQEIIATTLRDYTKKHNLKLQDIAEKLGWKKSKIDKLSTGSYNLSVPELGYFLSRLEKNPQEIFKSIK